MQVAYAYDMQVDAPGGPGPGSVRERYFASIPLGSVPSSYTPSLGPPTAPRLNGSDAFTTHSVGTAPVISWSAPSTGKATQYIVSLGLVSAQHGGDVVSLDAIVYSGSSFKVPGSFMKPGQYYLGRVEAVSSVAVLDGPVFPVLGGGSTASIGTVFGLFSP